MILIEFPIKVFSDCTGNASVLPGLLDANGNVMMQLLRYQLLLHTNGWSQSHLQKVRQAVKLFAEYSLANPRQHFGAAHTGQITEFRNYEHFRNFRKAIAFGTFNDVGVDPSGLNWSAGGLKKANAVTETVTQYLIWLDELDGGNRAARYNPHATPTKFEQLCTDAAYEWRRNKALLGHTWAWGDDKKVEAHRALSGTKPTKKTGDVKRISDQEFVRLLSDGFDTSTEVGLRDAMVSIMMNKAGVRVSEALGTWVIDVVNDPTNPGNAYVKLLHCAEAKCKIKHGPTKTYERRVDYLQAVHQLPNRISLPKGDRQHLGWKSRFDVLELYWAEPWWGKVFWGLYLTYIRLTTKKRKHPYLFIESDSGAPLGYDTFAKSYERAVYRAGLVPPGGVDLKNSGLTPHANRHAYGDRLKNKYGCNEKVVQKAMHHASVESQIVYTVPSADQTRDEIDRTMKSLATRKRNLEELKVGLKDIRPEINAKTAGDVSEAPLALKVVMEKVFD